MDMHVLCWDNNHNYLAIRYHHSEFIGKASVKNVFESFSACLSGISESKLLQVSSDGPNVNLSFLDLLEEDRNQKELSQHVYIGTCGLHSLHNSIKYGEKASDWNVKKLLTSLHRIFDMSHHLEELIMRHLHQQYLQTSHYSSVQIVGSKTRG